jgi:hypothetical protein
MESDSEATGHMTHGLKRSAASSSQPTCDEVEEELEGEEATSPTKEDPSQMVEELRATKQTRQTMILETYVGLQRPMGPVIQATARVTPGVKTLPVAK